MHQHDGLEPLTRPQVGDGALCFHCHRLLLYGDSPDGLALRRPTTEEQRRWDADPRVQAGRAALPATSVDEMLSTWRGSTVETINDHGVGLCGSQVVMLSGPVGPMAPDEALRMAAWIATLADPGGERFDAIRAAIRRT